MEKHQQYLIALGKKLKGLRKQKKLTQEQFANQVGLNYRHYQNIEGGKVDCKISTLHKFAMFYDIDLPGLMLDVASKGTFNFEDELAEDFDMQNIDKYLPYFEESPISLCLVSLDGTYEYVNPAFSKLYKIPAEELTGKSVGFVDQNPEKQVFYAEYTKFIQKTQPPKKAYIDKVHLPSGDKINIICNWIYLKKKTKLVGQLVTVYEASEVENFEDLI